ncbi:DUF5060 domain-containing protein [Paenibacillus sp. WQ 127069]|uniref:DUF5060 domain-containing protein n=1 Tax=Paenibacillus baimaensis TaxID=2982185 RepID=A0ABT2U7P0_9BACL|nr:DUF5060 domain-containing protein [Paenibacillus sp. WQ 127069]MCU6790623.1 DUF5060 domain-containing protein [Paenibacillus sp. WQ 127069]
MFSKDAIGMAADTLECWGRFERSFHGPAAGNPFQEITFQAEFRHHNRVVKTEGFYDGGGIYKLRFMPDAVGAWSYVTFSNCKELDAQYGQLQVSAPVGINRGLVRVKDAYRFTYSDGTPYLPFGTTLYHWFHHGDEEQEQTTLGTLAASPFNKVRMCILPTGEMKPSMLAFAGNREQGVDIQQFNPDFFAHMEKRLDDLQQLGIEADIILFHPYDQGVWGFEQLEPEVEEAYLRYVIARLSSYRNVWWSIANEFDFNIHKSMNDWDRLLQTVQRLDPYGHLRSIHNGTKMYDYERTAFYDYTKPWITHQSIQHWDTSWTTSWLDRCDKPVVIDECCYEGDSIRRWGNISGEELLRRIWESQIRGGYASHGEAYEGQGGGTWISRGGTLVGESPKRIQFLRELMETGQADLWELESERTCFWIYLGLSRPGYWELQLPEHRVFHIDLIDTWEMQVERFPQTYCGSCKVTLPGKSYLALRITAVA